MGKRVAVITDATSAEHFFPAWFRYYGHLFGFSNLFVVTYKGLGKSFEGFALGAVWELESRYSDRVRAGTISDIVAVMLGNYDVVIRCDVDEFLVAHPARHASLSAYVEALTLPYVTAIGLDVIEEDGDAPLRLDGAPMLGQRRYCVGTTSLNKTALVTVPVRWSIGFHFTDVRPCPDDLLLMHMKFADVGRRIDWFEQMRAVSEPGSSEDEAYTDGATKLRASRRVLTALPRRDDATAFDMQSSTARFMASVEEPKPQGFFTYPFMLDDVVRRIPDALRTVV